MSVLKSRAWRSLRVGCLWVTTCIHRQTCISNMHNIRSAVTDDRPYSDRFYTGRTVSDLPRQLKFDDVIFSIGFAKHSEVTSLLSTMIQSAIVRSDNVGIDEYNGSYTDFYTEYSFIFTARWEKSESIVAFIVIAPSMFSRTFDPSLADIRVFRTSDVTDAAYVGLVDLALELTRELDVGYMECLVSIAATCSNLIDLLIHQLQFTVIATMPQSVKIGGVADELVDNKVLIRNIVSPDHVRQPRSSEQVLSMLAQHGCADGPDDDAEYEKATLPQLPFLPEKYYVPNSNLVITIRNMYKHEDRFLFEMLNHSMEKGEGIAIHDQPNLALFRSFLLLEGPLVVFEDSTNDSVIGYTHMRPSWLMRSIQAKCAETFLIIDKPYQGRGIGGVVAKLINAMVKQYGYNAIVNDYFSNNVRSQRLSSSFATVLGVIPRAAYLVGKGWQGQVVVRVDVSKDPSFTQLIEENRQTSTMTFIYHGGNKTASKL